MAVDVPESDEWRSVSWSGAVAPVRRALAVERAGTGSTAAPFKAQVEDGPLTATYWVKAANGPEGICGLIAEAIVSRLGAAIGAPVCETAFIDVRAFAGWRYLPDRALGTSYAYGSREVPNAYESRLVQHRTLGDNRARLARAYALHQWCLDGDDQWLYAKDNDYRIYSHDHGRWLLDTTAWPKSKPPVWSAATLNAITNTDWHTPQLPGATFPDEIHRAADAVAATTHADIVAVLDPIAGAWGSAPIKFSDGLGVEDTLRQVGHWLEARRDRIVNRLG